MVTFSVTLTHIKAHALPEKDKLFAVGNYNKKYYKQNV